MYHTKERGSTIKTYAYCRVSTTEQNEDRQLDAIAELNIPNIEIFVDKQSGKDFDRPAFKKIIRKLRCGDLLYVKSIDRLGRNYVEIQNYWRRITKDIGADIVVLDMPILDTRSGKDLLGTFIADTVLAVLSFVAQNERENIRIRQMEGIASAKLRGVKFGRPKKALPKNFAKIVKAWEQGQIKFKEALMQTGLKEATFYNRLREHRQKEHKH